MAKYLDKEGLTRVWTKITSKLSGKVDKVSGKQLSTNDYTTAEKNKLSGIATGAEVNQNAFSNVKVGDTTVAADNKTDTLTLVAGSNITLTPDATNDKITIAAKDTTYTAATTSAAGLMSASDKSKLDQLTETGEYILPAATSSTLGGVKTGANITNSSGTISLTKANVTAALGYTPPTTDTDTHYTTHLKVGASATATANAAASNGSVYMNALDNTTVRDSHKIVGTGATTVVSDANGNITINSTNTTYTALKNPNAITISLNGTSQGAYDGSAAKSINITASSVGAAASSHTHNYAGSSSAGGAATSANKLNTNAGNATKPVYFSNGIPVQCTDVDLAITSTELAAILV